MTEFDRTFAVATGRGGSITWEAFAFDELRGVMVRRADMPSGSPVVSMNALHRMTNGALRQNEGELADLREHLRELGIKAAL